MPTTQDRRRLKALDERLQELLHRRSQCSNLIGRALAEIARIEAEADQLLDARMLLMDDGR